MSVILCAHPILGELHIQRHANQEVATTVSIPQRQKIGWKENQTEVSGLIELSFEGNTRFLLYLYSNTRTNLSYNLGCSICNMY